MTATAIESFEASLAGRDVPVTRTTAADASGELAELVAQPVVGAPIAIDGVSLPDSVTTDLSPSDVTAAKTGVTGVEAAIADYGSVVVAGGSEAAEHVSLFADQHVAVVAASDVTSSMRDALDDLGDDTRDGLTSAVIETGPSATADMGAVVTGVHGPTAVHVVLVTDR